MDVRWEKISSDDTTILIRINVKVNKPVEYLRDANFVFEYNKDEISFARNHSIGNKDTDYIWQAGFGPNDSTFCTVTRLNYNELSINIHIESLTGIFVSSETFTPVIDLKFRKIAKVNTTKLEWKMETRDGRIFETVFDKDFNAYDVGEGWDTPFWVKLE